MSELTQTLNYEVARGGLVVAISTAVQELLDQVREDCDIMLLVETNLKPLPLVFGQRPVKIHTQGLGSMLVSHNNVMTKSLFTVSYSYWPASIMLLTWVLPQKK